MYKIVLLRHGQSEWNKKNLFTGWTDVALSSLGKKEAKEAGKLLKKEGYAFDLAYTSPLMRAKDTLHLCLKEMKQSDIPITIDWRLNERHYGDLQGLNKAETTAKFGEKQVHIWRRSYATRPPALKISDSRHPANDEMYKDISRKLLPATECLKDVSKRVLPLWKKEIVPLIKEGKTILIAAHGNSLRTLVKYLDKISAKDISELNIPTGVPLVYELDSKCRAVRHYYLGDQAAIAKKIAGVKNQSAAKK